MMTNTKWKSCYSNSIHFFIINILKNCKQPMTVTQITQKVIQKRKIQNVKPRNTVSSVLQRSNFIESTARGYYRLKYQKLDRR